MDYDSSLSLERYSKMKINTVFTESGYVRKDLDSYFTEGWVTQWLCDAGLARHEPKSVTWEPCAGVGSMSHVLIKNGHEVLSTDIHNHGWEGLDGIYDFLAVKEIDPSIHLIISNPPYKIEGIIGVPDCTAVDFVRHALKLTKPVNGSVAMLLRNEFDCASTRKELFDRPPFAAKFVLTSRPSWIDESMMRPGKEAGPRHNYSWYVWSWASNFEATINYLPFEEGQQSAVLTEL